MKSMPSATMHSVPAWRLWIGPLVWAAHFLAIYAFTASACARYVAMGAFGVGVVAWFIGAVTAIAAAVLGVTIALALLDGRRSGSHAAPAGFVHWLTAAIACLVLLAIVWEALPILFMPFCS
jgi:hypothetical protein